MPVLTWIGKEAVVNHHKNVPYRLLQCDPELSAGSPNGNLLIEGDNLEALKALLPYYAGRVKLVYIDPPYNTGNEGWRYNDRVNSPQIRAWLGKVVGGEGEDLSRHDKWLCMMYPRLRLLREFLRDDGVIVVAIDDNELAYLRVLMDELFEESNWLATLAWEKTRKNDARFFSLGHDYMLIYGRNVEHLRSLGAAWREPKPGAAEIIAEYERLRELHGANNAAIEQELRAWYEGLPKSHPSKKLSRYKHVDSRGVWRDRDISWPGGGGPRYDVIHPDTHQPCKVPDRGWGFATLEAMQREIRRGRIEFRTDHTEPPIFKAYLNPVIVPEDEEADLEEAEDEEAGLQVMPSVIYRHTQPSVRLLRKIMGGKVFNNPKDHEVLARLIRYMTAPGDIIMDSFAGSGSTGHAVLHLNHQEGTDRRFILVEIEPEIARQVTSERLRRVIAGYPWTGSGKEHQETGIGGSFRYCTLGPAIFLSDGTINPTVTWEDLGRHIWFTETYTPWPGIPCPRPPEQPPSWLGAYNGISYYLYFDGIGGNAFGSEQLAELPADEMPSTVYADRVEVDVAELEHRLVTFKQIPYDLEVD